MEAMVARNNDVLFSSTEKTIKINSTRVTENMRSVLARRHNTEILFSKTHG